eukprot:COSAG03_NODE_507_length_7348_cov_8.004966_2_plen_130_part_00
MQFREADRVEDELCATSALGWWLPHWLQMSLQFGVRLFPCLGRVSVRLRCTSGGPDCLLVGVEQFVPDHTEVLRAFHRRPTTVRVERSFAAGHGCTYVLAVRLQPADQRGLLIERGVEVPFRPLRRPEL